jgi:hypothetical protein
MRPIFADAEPVTGRNKCRRPFSFSWVHQFLFYFHLRLLVRFLTLA